MSRSRQLSVRIPWPVLDSLTGGTNQCPQETTSSAITCALRTMALLGLNCAITRRIGELPLQEQDLVDDLYASLTGKLPAYALWTAILEHLQISDYDPQLHPEQVDAVVALLLRLGQKHASGEDALLYLGLETPALA